MSRLRVLMPHACCEPGGGSCKRTVEWQCQTCGQLMCPRHWGEHQHNPDLKILAGEPVAPLEMSIPDEKPEQEIATHNIFIQRMPVEKDKIVVTLLLAKGKIPPGEQGAYVVTSAESLPEALQVVRLFEERLAKIVES